METADMLRNGELGSLIRDCAALRAATTAASSQLRDLAAQIDEVGVLASDEALDRAVGLVRDNRAVLLHLFGRVQDAAAALSLPTAARPLRTWQEGR
jgi:hypothetical protein